MCHQALTVQTCYEWKLAAWNCLLIYLEYHEEYTLAVGHSNNFGIGLHYFNFISPNMDYIRVYQFVK